MEAFSPGERGSRLYAAPLMGAQHRRGLPPFRTREDCHARGLPAARLLPPARWLAFVGLPGAASYLLRSTVESRPDLADACFLLGECALRRKRWAEAADAFQAAVQRRPGDVEALGNLTLALVRMGAIERAGQALRRIIERRPADPEPRLLLGALYRRQRRMGESIAAFREAARLRPMPATRRFYLGETLLGPREWARLLATHREAQPMASLARPAAPRVTSRRRTHTPAPAARPRQAHPRAPFRLGDRLTAAWLVAKGKARLLLGRIDSTERRPHEAIRAFRDAFERRAGAQTSGGRGSALAQGASSWRV